jgi:hypothetical protein
VRVQRSHHNVQGTRSDRRVASVRTAVHSLRKRLEAALLHGCVGRMQAQRRDSGREVTALARRHHKLAGVAGGG